MTQKIFILAALVSLTAFWSGWLGNGVDYNEDVKPILNKHCLGCHGGVKQAGGVSFLFEEDLYKPAKSGKAPVVAGDADESEMMRRILSHDPDERMPKDGDALNETEVETLRQWINQGAKWGTHWSYKPIVSPAIPNPANFWTWLGFEDTPWQKNEIDHFVLDKLESNQLTPAPQASRATLVRRLSLDLTGLPPTDAQVTRFLNDKSANAYETLVDSLLASSAYGERWAAMWLDLARYADTKGYERDPSRTIWRYRDWLIKAFNEDKPFDRFTMEQIAGDLTPTSHGALPHEDLLVATGFHRNTMNNDEGGTQNEEFRVAALIDRVNTTWDVWHGTTFGCVQCHSHPYDPIRHDEYYKYLAFFNNTRDEDISSETPTLRFYKGTDSANVVLIENWLKKYSANPTQTASVRRFMRVMEPKFNSPAFDQLQNGSLVDAKYMGLQHGGSARLPLMNTQHKNRFVIAVGNGKDGGKLYLRADSAKGPIIKTIDLPNTKSNWNDTVLFVPVPSPILAKRLYLSAQQSPKNPKDWVIIKWVAFQESLPNATDSKFADIERTYASILTGNVDNTPILMEGTGELARQTNVFIRGGWTSKGPAVSANVPQLFKNDFSKNKIPNRLDLARWMTHRDNPLTARVFVNRIWEQLFGAGIVETVEDFGSQGIAPTHRELLDWLAANWMNNQGWSVKKLLKTIVMSATYQQSSATTTRKMTVDPFNKLLSRGARVRLTAEQVRDQALAVSGLISTKMYGPSVMPPQPEGVWQSPYNGDKWVASTSEDRYRRAVYTYWKRTAPYPSMMAFDAPSREFCQSRRIRTNTPLQALVTLNDPVFLEAAHCLAERMASKRTLAAQIGEGYRLLTHNTLTNKRLFALAKTYFQSIKTYQKSPEDIEKLLKLGNNTSAQIAALTITANVLLNLDEVVTKQ